MDILFALCQGGVWMDPGGGYGSDPAAPNFAKMQTSYSLYCFLSRVFGMKYYCKPF